MARPWPGHGQNMASYQKETKKNNKLNISEKKEETCKDKIKKTNQRKTNKKKNNTRKHENKKTNNKDKWTHSGKHAIC